MFRFLKTKLTVFYGGLLGAVLLAVSGAVYFSVHHTAQSNVEAELQATAAVYERLWSINEMQLARNADIMARDFGFREAVATEDVQTIASALENLRDRFDVTRAFLVLPDGRAIEAGSAKVLQTPAPVLAAMQADDRATGILSFEDVEFQAVSVPVLAPSRVGWVIFATKLDGEELSELESLSTIALAASIGSSAGTSSPPPDAIVATLPLQRFAGGPSDELLLAYPRSKAMAPFRPMLLAITILALMGLAVLLLCSWFISKSVTRPITVLERATHKLASGEAFELDVDSQDEIGRLAGSFRVMATKMAEREKSILKLSITDTETDLPNRRALHSAMVEQAEMASEDALYCVAFGFDRLLQIMSAIGQSNTNQMISKFGRRLSRQDSVIALGMLATGSIGVLIRAGDVQEAEYNVRELLKLVSAPISISGERIDLLISAGLSLVDPKSQPGPIDRALIALQQGRAAFKPVHSFDETAYGDPSGTLSLMSDMMAALQDGSIYMAYQPKYDLRSQAVKSTEALLRWNHPERGFIRPDIFVEYAEETGHILPLSKWVLVQSMADRREFLESGHDLIMSINISGRLLTNDAFLRWSIDTLGADACRFCFEVTETAVIDDPAKALANIEMLRAAGIEISIDDYGSGLSSLSYLKQIPAQELKIDKSFVLPLKPNSSDALLVKSTIDLAHSLGMSVTAEGVETAEALALLSSMGADVAQGYFFCKPAKSSEIMRFLTEWKKASAQLKLSQNTSDVKRA